MYKTDMGKQSLLQLQEKTSYPVCVLLHVSANTRRGTVIMIIMIALKGAI